MQFDLERVASRAKDRFLMSPNGLHGVAHWQRVAENGIYLAERNGANEQFVQLFAWLHDCCRESDGQDPEHGIRAAEFAISIRSELIDADDSAFDDLLTALRDHTHVKHSDNLNIGTCWDADRLDLARVGMDPDPAYFSTAEAKQKSVLRWAVERSLQWRRDRYQT